MKKEFPISAPRSALIDFVFSELDKEKRDNYLLQIKVHKKYSDLHLNEKGDIEVFYRKSPKKEPIELTRKEYEALVKTRAKNSNLFGFIVFSFAFKREKLLDLIVVEAWGEKSQALRFDVKIIKNRLEILKDSLDIVWT